MKKHTIKSILLALILFGGTISCSDLLDQTNPNALSTENFWQNEQQVQEALVGTYSPMSTVYGWGRYFPLIWIRRADEYTPSFSSVFARGIITSSSDIFLPTSWPTAYKVVFRANNIIDNIDRVPDMSQEVKDEVLGQAYFLRGLYYFYMVNVWDNIPLITNAAKTTDDFFVPNSTPDAVYEQVISDALLAKSLLPTDWDEKGRATWGAATALLGKAYLYTGQWALAADEFKEIIDSDIYSLSQDYAENFKYSGDNNEESVFEVQFVVDPDGAWGQDRINSGRGSWWVQMRAPLQYGGEWFDQINPWVLDAFLEEQNLDGGIDERAFTTLVWDHPDCTIYLEQPFAESALDPAKVYAKKNTGMLVEGREADNDLGKNCGLNYKLIRYADVLLMHAEAANEAGKPESEILASINKVRARANMPNIPAGLSQNELREKIRKERILELSLETDRFFDLKRWGVLVDRMNSNADMIGNIGASSDQIRAEGQLEYEFPFAEMHTRLPIPIAEITSNPAIKQNTGY